MKSRRHGHKRPRCRCSSVGLQEAAVGAAEVSTEARQRPVSLRPELCDNPNRHYGASLSKCDGAPGPRAVVLVVNDSPLRPGCDFSGGVSRNRRATTIRARRSNNSDGLPAVLSSSAAAVHHVVRPVASGPTTFSTQYRQSIIPRRASSARAMRVTATAALLVACCCYSASIVDAFALSPVAVSPRGSRSLSAQSSPDPPTNTSASSSASKSVISSTSLGVRKNRADFTTDGARYDKIARNSVDVLTAVGNTRTGKHQHKQQHKQQQQKQQKEQKQHQQRSAVASSTVVTTKAAAATVPNPLLDAFHPTSPGSLYEILTPRDATLMGTGSGSRSVTAAAVPLAENEEATQRKSVVDQRVADLLADDSGEDDDDEDVDERDDDGDIKAVNDDASDEAGANDIADRRSYSQMSDYAKARATQAMSKSTVGAASIAHVHASLASSGGRKVVSKKKRVTASVQETGRDTINSYTKSFTNHELLSREAEATLGREIQLLVRWEETRQELEVELLRAPTFGEWAKALDVTVTDLKKQIRKSQRAKAALIEANLRLVVTSARSLVKKSRSEISFHDACQDGIIGLTRACEKFNPDKDFRFSTYALWWIKGEIMKSVNSQASTIRLPNSARKKINEIRINERILMAEKGRKPTDEEVAKKSDLTLQQLWFYRRSAQDVVSIDQTLQAQRGKGSSASGDSAKGVTQIGDLVKDEGPSPEEVASKQMLKEDVRRLVKSLSPREQVVIRMRFGLDDGEPKTLDAIAKKFRVATNQIKKLETRALAKLRQRGPDSSLLD